MPRYFFDSHDGAGNVIDDVGVEFSDLEAVKVETARGLADLARDVLPGSVRRELSIDVRDDQNQAVLRAVMVFEIRCAVS